MLINRLTPNCRMSVNVQYSLSVGRNYDRKTYHPLPTFARLLPLDVHLELAGQIVILARKRIRQLTQLIYGIPLNKLFIVQMIEQKAKPLLYIPNLRRE